MPPLTASRRRRVSTRLTGVLGLLVVVMAALARVPSLWYGLVGTVLAASAVVVALWHRDELTTRQVVGLAIAFRLAFLPLLPVLSDDAYRYVWDGLIQANGINPYLHRPEASELAGFQDEPIYEALNSASYYSVYPPLSQLIFWVGGLFYDWGWTASYFVIKGLFAACEVGAVAVLAQLVTARNVMLYAWHPVALLEGAGQGHTEAAAVFFMLMAVWMVRRGAPLYASLALTAAVWVKLIPAILFPLLVRRFGVWTVLPAAGATLVLLAPYASLDAAAHFATSLTLYVQLFEFNAGFYYGVKEAFRVATGADWSKTLGPAFGWVLAATLPALYVLDARRSMSFALSGLLCLSAFFLLSTTIHPWYLLMVLPFAVLVGPVVWAWWWLGVVSIATYLFYVGGPYWSTVVVGWGGAAAIAVRDHGPEVVQRVMRARARAKGDRVLSALRAVGAAPPQRILDLGAGEGYVGRVLAARTGAEVQLVDVVDLNRTRLPHATYDGRHVPFADGAFDVVVLYFVLHHCADPATVVREALRVSQEGVVIVESTYDAPWQHRALRVVDTVANRVRSAGAMNAQEEHLHFRTPAAWKTLVEEAGGVVQWAERRGGGLHPQCVLVARKG